VDKYERSTYAPGTYDSLVSQRQRGYLRKMIPAWFAQPPVQHDFACGTGRAITMLDGLVSDAHGYDTSSAMLNRATSNQVNAQLHLLDPADPPSPHPDSGNPCVVTMFRFLLNVDSTARQHALAFAAQALPQPDSGVLVVENHGPRHSLRGLGRWRHRDHGWFAELSHRQVTDLLAQHGFTIVARKGFGVMPPGSYRRRATRPLAHLADRTLGPLPIAPFATNVLYVAKRASTTQ
jgi:predicted TPR repeat methyltransferase